MISRTAISLALAFGLLTATVRVPTAPCFVTNTPSPKACEMGCCHNKTCCATSHERTGPVSQPLSKASYDQKTFAPIPATAPVSVFIHYASEPEFISSEYNVAHSPAPLALICIRLI